MSPSNTTQHLIDLLKDRDAKGKAKYGVSLDRDDLTAAEWCRHAVEELLDGAGYLVRLEQRMMADKAVADTALSVLREALGEPDVLLVEAAVKAAERIKAFELFSSP